MKKIFKILLISIISYSCSAQDTIINNRYDTIPPKIEGYIIITIIDYDCFIVKKKTKKECTTYAYVRKENE